MNSTDELGAWWTNGYQLRNRTVHRGYRPTGTDAAAAVMTANHLVDAVIDRIRLDPRFASVLPPKP